MLTSRALFAAFSVALAACGGASSPSNNASPKNVADSRARGWSDSEAAVPASSDDPMWGDRDAPVTIVEFADFQCHFCAVVEPTLRHIKDAYGPHKLRIIWKNLPLEEIHPQARGAAEAARGVFELAGNDAFWRFHDAAFDGQTLLTRASYEAWAEHAGISDLARYRAGLDARTFGRKVDDDRALAEAIGVGGTPAFFINAVFISGAEREAKFTAIIDRELLKAEAVIAHGVPRDRVYVAMSRENAKNGGRNADDADEEEDTTTVWKIPAQGPALGGAVPLVTILEFGDYEDKFTRKVQETLDALRGKYGDDLRLIWKDEPLPMHAHAEPGAELALEARAEHGDPGFWSAHDMLLRRPLDDLALSTITNELSLDLAKAHEAMENKTHEKEIDADLDLMDDFGAYGTPHFFINGRRLVGAQPQKRFEQIIDEEIAKAKALVASGTPRAGIYDALVANGKPAPPTETKVVAESKAAPWKGSVSPKVTIEMFSDFQCPFCSRVEPTLKQVMDKYGTRIRLVWRNLPLPMHADAPLAAQAAMEAFKQKGEVAFWKMHDVMFEHQDDLKRPALDGYARDLGLDMDKWAAALDGQTNKPLIDADAKAALDGGIQGTPAFIVRVAGSAAEAKGEGYFISGAHPYAKFRKVIERALAEAK